MSNDKSTSLMALKWKLMLKAHKDDCLSGTDHFVLCYLLERYNREYQVTWCGYSEIAQDIGKSTRSAKRSIHKLIERGFIHVAEQGHNLARGGRGKVNRYGFNFEQVLAWTPGWCDKKNSDSVVTLYGKTVTGLSPFKVKTVTKLTPFSPKTVTGFAPVPSSLFLPIAQEKPSATHTRDSEPQDQAPGETQAEGCVCEDFSVSEEEVKNPAGGNGGQVTDEQMAFIRELVNQDGIRNPGAYKASLIAKAKRGELEMPDNGNGSGGNGDGPDSQSLGVDIEEVKQAVQGLFDALMDGATGTKYSLQGLVDDCLVKKEAIEPYTAEQTMQAVRELYPDEAKVTDRKKMLCAVIRAEFRKYDSRLTAYENLKYLDQALADKVRDEVGLVTEVY